MKAVILCGGRGTRLGKHGESVPKSLVEIGGRPILDHLMQRYSHYGINEFILCLGYLGDAIEQHFSAPPLHQNRHIIFADTGLETNTGGRLKKIEKFLIEDETFCLTYGDGLADIDIHELIQFHKQHGKIATVTVVNPQSNFGILELSEKNEVIRFQEKPVMKEWINGGFFVFNRSIFNYLTENCVLEREPLEQLAAERQLIAYKHIGFWKCMDTLKDNIEFNELWGSGRAYWGNF